MVMNDIRNLFDLTSYFVIGKLLQVLFLNDCFEHDAYKFDFKKILNIADDIYL